MRKIKRQSTWKIAWYSGVCLFLLVAIFLAGPLPAEEGAQYFLQIPGIPGDVQLPQFKGWIACIAVQYRVPGVPAPQILRNRSPNQRRGMLTAAEVDKPYGTFSAPLAKLDRRLSNALRDKHIFPQWKLALGNSSGETYMEFIFKNVVITSINRRDNNYYLTFRYEIVIWNYTGTR